MKKPLVSFILPMKNNGIFVLKFLKALEKNPYDNLEIIIIDDSSKDDSIEKIKDYVVEEKLRNIKLFRQEQDRPGILNSRNLGIKESTGDYIIFPEINDTIDDYFIIALLSTLINGEESFALTGICDYYTGTGNQKQRYLSLTPNKKPKETFENYRKRLLRKDYRLYPLYNKLFSAKIIKEHELKFEKSKHIAPELDFIIKYIEAGDIKNFITINKPLYIHNISKASEKLNEQNTFRKSELNLKKVLV